jgi:hypothetical protein
MRDCAKKSLFFVLVIGLAAALGCGGGAGTGGGESAELSPFIQSDTTPDPGPWGGEGTLMFILASCGDARLLPECSERDFRRMLDALGFVHSSNGWLIPSSEAWDAMLAWIKECRDLDGERINWEVQSGNSFISLSYDEGNLTVETSVNSECPEAGGTQPLQ